MDNKLDFVYNPDNQTKRQLIDNFVVRLDLFEELLIKIQSLISTKSSPGNFIIEGKRGMGKTTMLLRLGYEIESNVSTNESLIPVVFNEEEYSIRRLYKLWERLAIILEERHPFFDGLFLKMDSGYSEFDSEEDYEQYIFDLLRDSVKNSGKKLILLIDNFGDIYSKFSDIDAKKLDDLLTKNSFFHVVAASSVSLDGFFNNQDHVFEVFRLAGLSSEETKNLLLKFSETFDLPQIVTVLDTQPRKVETLRRLTGGVIRTIVLLFEIFIDHKNGSTFSDLETLLDRVTPLYKHRMDDLTPQQQEIIEALAFAWDAISAKEISSKTRIVSKSISAQLIQMEEMRLSSRNKPATKTTIIKLVNVSLIFGT